VNHYLPAASSVLSGEQWPWGYAYPPLFAIILSPLALLQPMTAIHIWTVIGLLITGFVWLMPLLLKVFQSATVRLLYSTGLLSSFPVIHNLSWGQVGTLTLLLTFLMALSLSNQKNKALSSFSYYFAYTFLCTIKPFYGLLVILGLWKHCRRRIVVAMGIAVLANLLIPLIAIGHPKTYQQFLNILEFAKIMNTYAPSDINSQYLYFVIQRTLGLDPEWALLGNALLLVAAGLVGFWIMRSGRSPNRIFTLRENLKLLMLGLCLAPLVVKTSWPHYFTQIPLLICILIEELRLDTGKARLQFLGRLHLALLLASMVSICLPLVILLGGFEQYNRLGILSYCNFAILIYSIGTLADSTSSMGEVSKAKN
jgi:hypothetical protein